MLDDATISYFQSKLPNEACGVLVKGEFIPFENKSPRPDKTFLINDPLYDELYINFQIDYLIHSHYDRPLASLWDQNFAQILIIPSIILNFNTNGSYDKMGILNNPEIEPVLGRQFFFGVHDCLTASTDHVYLETGIKLLTPPREFNFWRKDEPIFENYLYDPEYPVDEIELKDVKPLDFIFYKFRSKVINHMGVMLDDNNMIQHFNGAISKEYPINAFMRHAATAGRVRR